MTITSATATPLLNDLFGATTHVLGRGQNAPDFAKRPCGGNSPLKADGPYLTPGGGSSCNQRLGLRAVRVGTRHPTELERP